MIMVLHMFLDELLADRAINSTSIHVVQDNARGVAKAASTIPSTLTAEPKGGQSRWTTQLPTTASSSSSLSTLTRSNIKPRTTRNHSQYFDPNGRWASTGNLLVGEKRLEKGMMGLARPVRRASNTQGELQSIVSDTNLFLRMPTRSYSDSCTTANEVWDFGAAATLHRSKLEETHQDSDGDDCFEDDDNDNASNLKSLVNYYDSRYSHDQNHHHHTGSSSPSSSPGTVPPKLPVRRSSNHLNNDSTKNALSKHACPLTSSSKSFTDQSPMIASSFDTPTAAVASKSVQISKLKAMTQGRTLPSSKNSKTSSSLRNALGSLAPGAAGAENRVGKLSSGQNNGGLTLKRSGDGGGHGAASCIEFSGLTSKNFTNYRLGR